MSISTANLVNELIKENKDHSFFSWAIQGIHNPTLIDHAKGVYLYAKEGKRYLDFSSQLMNVNIGHGREEVTQAVIDQMNKFSYLAPSFATDARGKLAKKLAEISPGNLTKTFFTLGGAEAIENAIKLARVYSGKHKIITQYRSYHGSTMGAISAGGDPRKHLVDQQQLNNIVRVENPYAYRCPWGTDSAEACGERAIANLRQVIQYEGPQNIAGILMEGESGTSGCIKYPPFYLKKVKALCEEFDLLFIADEVMSGFCRTGNWFGVNNHEVEPDILVFAKGVTAGYIPLGGLIASKEIANYFDDKFLPLGLTYSAHTVSCAAALAVIDIYEKENLNERAREMGAYIDQKVEALAAKHNSIGDWRNTGMLGCIELVKNRDTKEPMSPWNAPLSEAMQKVKAKIHELGMFTFAKWNFIFVAPPLTITKEEIDEGMEIISLAIAEADAYCV
ncbi:MAG: aminotransferase class III-fold pyridoxal phosphate-dependent enzyme [Bacteroidia bacterium]|nr:aminotransferase class III-fold pyridoxal phosphate-dependent enzyme [Bacteroidia bacterium]